MEKEVETRTVACSPPDDVGVATVTTATTTTDSTVTLPTSVPLASAATDNLWVALVVLLEPVLKAEGLGGGTMLTLAATTVDPFQHGRTATSNTAASDPTRGLTRTKGLARSSGTESMAMPIETMAKRS